MEDIHSEVNKGNGRDKPTHIPRDVRQLLALTERQQSVLRLADAGLTPAQFVAIRELLKAEADEKAETEKVTQPTSSDGPPMGLVAAISALAGFVGGAWLVAAVTPKPPPSLKARLANWLLSEY